RVLTRNYSEGRMQQSARTTYPLAEALKEEYPEIIRSSRYMNFWETFVKGEAIVEGTLATVDRDFLEMLNVEFISGDIKSALSGPYDIVLTQDMVERYFGREDPLGKAMTLWPDYTFTVSGVIKNFPRNSHFYLDCLVTSEFLKTKHLINPNDWKNLNTYTFIELHDGADSRLVEEKIKGTVQRRLEGSKDEIFLQNIKLIHLYSRGQYAQDIERGSISQVRIAALVALLILTIACINFMNLFTAQSSGRLREIGLRKVAGAGRFNIIVQFLGESLLTVTMAAVVAMILVELLLPMFNTVMLSAAKLNYGSFSLYAGIILMVLFCGLLAGTYPAMYLSSLEPMNIIKGNVLKKPRNAGFRRILVIIQFTLSFLFIICTLIIRTQLDYIHNHDLGVNIKNIGFFVFTDEIQRETLRNELAANPGIVNLTFTDNQWVVNNWSTASEISWEGKKAGEEILFSVLFTDTDYAGTFHLELKDGRFLSVNEATGNSEAVINEKAAEILGFDDPVGKVLTSGSGHRFTIVGVVRDFHFKSLHNSIDPLLIVPINSNAKGGHCYISMKPDQAASTIKSVRSVLKEHNIDYSLIFYFLTDIYNDHYQIERVIGTMFGWFTLLAILISCLGLIGLSAFTTVQRTKEIGIRKVNGARSSEVFSLLLKDYLKLILISFLIATPVAWFAMKTWLQGFAYRINISWWMFALSLIIVIVLTILTVGIQSYKASSRNPIDALRYE
ncbi:MAG: FtsX-like permease family protein, partial [Bacteroidales bacterium]|nr:FtsX-like permease family protein [Bacteroidales bacterium]